MLKRIVLLIAIIFLSGNLFADSYNEDQRIEYTINEQWEFYYSNVDGSVIDIPESNWEKINLPHTWNSNEEICDTASYSRGIGFYRKNLFISETQKDKRVFLYFEGANQIADLYVNGQNVGKHIGGYTAFSFEITDYVHYGKNGKSNQILVKVDNRLNKNVAPLSADYTFYGGIYRDAWVIITNNIHFSLDDFGSKSVYISTPNVSNKEGSVKLSGKIQNQSVISDKFLIKNSIYDVNNNLILSSEKKLKIGANTSVNFDFDELIVKQPLLWSPKTPNLYTAQTEIYHKGELIDRLINNFGFRYFSFDSNKGFYLNGEHLKLIGTNRHQDCEGIGNALSNRLHVKDIEMIKAAGFNFLRLAHYPQDPAVLNAADRLGLLIWEEIPVVNYVTESEEFLGNCKNMLKEMIRQNYNHPSIVFWGYMNEVYLHDAHGDRKDEMAFPDEYLSWTKYLSNELNNLAHEEDPIRLTAIAIHQHDRYDETGISEIPDVVGYNLYQGWYSSRSSDFGEFIDEVHEKYPERKIIISEYGAGSDERLHSYNPVRFDFTTEYQQSLHEEFLKQIKERPFIGASAVWCQSDFGSNTRGDSKPKVNQKGLQYFNREPKDIYYYYKASLNPEPEIRIASHDWKIRVKSSDDDQNIHSIKIYSNVPELEIFVDGKLERTIEVNRDHIAFFDFQPKSKNHIIEARAEINGKFVSDQLELCFLSSAKLLNDNFQNEIAVNVGAPLQFTDDNDCLWLMDQAHSENTWGFCNQGTMPLKFTKGILGSKNDPLYQFYREGVSKYRFDVKDGTYEIEIYLAELTHKEVGQRVMDVSINNNLVWDNLDLVKEYGAQRAISRKFTVSAKNSKGIEIGFIAKSGITILNGLRVIRLSN